MSLERNMLARMDRRLLSGLDQDESFRMARVPVTAAKWSTWRRYCDAASISMGRAIAVLIDHEPVGQLGKGNGEGVAVLADPAEEQLVAREQNVEAAELRLRGWIERLRHQEAELQIREQRIEMTSKAMIRPRQTDPKVGSE